MYLIHDLLCTLHTTLYTSAIFSIEFWFLKVALSPSTRHIGDQFLAQGHSPLLVPFAFRNMACHEQINFSTVEKFMRRVAEEEGFEPPVSYPTTVFKTAAFDLSATPPRILLVGDNKPVKFEFQI